MKKRWLILSFVLASASAILAQATKIATSATLPTSCTVGNVYLKTSTSAGFYLCLATNTWTGPLASGATGTVTNTGTLTANRIILGNGGVDVTALGSLGTTTTLLHGNAGGAPSFAAVDLANDVSGNLGVAHLNSGTSANSSTYWRGDGTWGTPSGTGATMTLIVKPSDESVTSSTTMQDDNDFSISIGANEKWSLKFSLLLDGATTGDFRFTIVAPTGATGWYGGVRLVDTASGSAGQNANWSADTALDGTGARFVGGAGAGVLIATPLEAVVINGSTSGTVKLQWAQITSSGTASIVKANSILIATKLN